jgi:hypothetical protein
MDIKVLMSNVEKPKTDKAVFTFGRFSPPTTGHAKLVNRVIDHAYKSGADHHIFLSHTQDHKKNPLKHSEKVKFARKFFPHANIHSETNIKNPNDALEHLHKNGYKHVTMLVGADRVQSFHNLFSKYKPEGMNVEVKSAGERDPDAEGVEGMSASKMRDFAAKKKFNDFKKGVPVQQHARELYRAVRKGMRLENFQKHFKALFLVGGPGSGKDFIITSLLESANLVELPLDKFVKAIVNCENIPELEKYPSLIVNGNAERLDSIEVSKRVLESMGYDTAMIFVYTSNDESKARNDKRIVSGNKTLSEEVRYSKYSSAIANMHKYSAMFEQFNIFDNSGNLSDVGAVRKQEILGWLEELGTQVASFYEPLTKNEAAQIWLMNEGGNVKVGEHSAEPIHVTELNRDRVQSDIHHTLDALHDSFHREHGIELFGKNKRALHSGAAYSGSTRSLMNKEIPHEEFVKNKPSVGDIDVQIPKEHADKLAEHLKAGKHFGNYHVIGVKKHGLETSALMKHHSGKIHQFDFEHVKYHQDEPTQAEQFAHGSAWEDIKAGVKGMHHKTLLNAIGGDKFKFSITHGLKSREDESDPGESDPHRISRKLFGFKADHEKIHSFIGLADLIKHHVPKEQHLAIYNKFKEATDSKKKIDSSKALKYLHNHLDIKDNVNESGAGAPGGYPGDKSGSETDKGEIMAKDYPKPKGKKKYTNLKMKSKNKPGEKTSTPPPSFFDQRMGVIPSGCSGLTVSHFVPSGNVLKEKSFERLRKNLSSIVNNVDAE